MTEFIVSVTLPGTPEHFTRTCAAATVIGRSDGCEIQLAHPLVSRRHVELIPQAGDRLLVRDLGSRNGTIVNGEPVREAEAVVQGEATLQVGPYVVIVVPSAAINDSTVLLQKPTAASTRVTLDRGLRTLLVDGEPAIERLSVLEYRLLDTLDSAAPNLIENRALGDAVWDPGQWDSYMLHNLIRRVRRKLEERLGESAEMIATVPGVGYRLV